MVLVGHVPRMQREESAIMHNHLVAQTTGETMLSRATLRCHGQACYGMAFPVLVKEGRVGLSSGCRLASPLWELVSKSRSEVECLTPGMAGLELWIG